MALTEKAPPLHHGYDRDLSPAAIQGRRTQMAGNDATRKVFEAWNESSDALVDAVRAANDRGHRIAAALIEEAQESQRTSVELAKKWAAAPFDFFGFYGALIETATKAQGRALDVSRQWFGELADIQKETREVVTRMTAANRTAGEAGVEVARGMLTRASDAIQTASQSMAQAATGNGRRTPQPTRAGGDGGSDTGYGSP
jgi:hypothetical protein